MKRLFAATAITSVLATAGFAASEAEKATIQQYFPQANVEALSDEQVTRLITIARSGDTESEKLQSMRSIITVDNMVSYTVSEAEMTELMRVAPGVDFSTFSDAELAQAVSIIRSADSNAEQQLRALATRNAVITTDMLTEAERTEILRVAPELNLSMLSDEEILQIQTALNSGDENDVRDLIRSITDS